MVLINGGTGTVKHQIEKQESEFLSLLPATLLLKVIFGKEVTGGRRRI